MRILSTARILPLFLVVTSYAATSNTFQSVTVGFAVTKPDTWSFLTATQNLENLKRTQLNDEEFRQLMLKYSTAPLVAMTKYPEPFDDLNPSLKVNIKPFGKLKGVDPKQILAAISSQFGHIFQDFEVVQPPTDTVVSGIRSGYMKINYSLQIPDGRTNSRMCRRSAGEGGGSSRHLIQTQHR